MKPFFITFLLSCLPVLAEETIVTSKTAYTDLNTAKNVCVQIEWIKVNKIQFNQLLMETTSAGNKLRDAVQKLILKEQAEVLDCSMSTARPGEISRSSSAISYIYPTEYNTMGGFPSYYDPGYPDLEKMAELSRIERQKVNYYTESQLRNGLVAWSAFEERPVGHEIHITPLLNQGASKTLSLDLGTDKLELATPNLLKDHKDQWGTRKEQMPSFNRYQLRTMVPARSGDYLLLSSDHALLPNGKVDPDHTVVIFVRATINLIK